MKDRQILDSVISTLRLYADRGTPMSPLSARKYASLIEELRAEEKDPSETRVTDGIHDVAPTPIEEQHKAYDEYARYSKLADWPKAYDDCVQQPYRSGPGHLAWCAQVNGIGLCDCGYFEPTIAEVRGEHVWSGVNWQRLERKK